MIDAQIDRLIGNVCKVAQNAINRSGGPHNYQRNAQGYEEVLIAIRELRSALNVPTLQMEWVSIADRLPEKREKPYQCVSIAVKKYPDDSNYPGMGIRSVVQDWVIRQWPENFTTWMEL